MSHNKVLIGAAILAVVGAGIATNLQRKPAPFKVQLEPVARRDLTALVSGSGKIRPYKEVDVSSNVMGRITRLAVVEGQQVQPDDLLLQIDPVRFQSAVEQVDAGIAVARTQLQLAEQNLEFARQTMDRREGLHRQDLLSKEAYDEALR